MFYLYLLEIYQLFVTVSRRGESSVNSETVEAEYEAVLGHLLLYFLELTLIALTVLLDL